MVHLRRYLVERSGATIARAFPLLIARPASHAGRTTGDLHVPLSATLVP